MKEFLYTGDSVMNFSLNTEGETTEHVLIPGEKSSLPEKNDHVKVLVAKGLLVEPKTEKKQSKSE